jgi:TATA-box binding protein (TBP) (component of TFIID and TFIIIB)
MENERSTIVAVIPPTVIKEPEPAPGTVVAAAETAAEPVVFTKGKKVEEGAEAAATPEKKAPEKKAPEKK